MQAKAISLTINDLSIKVAALVFGLRGRRNSACRKNGYDG